MSNQMSDAPGAQDDNEYETALNSHDIERLLAQEDETVNAASKRQKAAGDAACAR